MTYIYIYINYVHICVILDYGFSKECRQETEISLRELQGDFFNVNENYS